MKYSVDIILKKPIEEVIDAFNDTNNRSKWMPGFLDAKALEGVEGQPGAKSALTFQMGKRRMVMVETILERPSETAIRVSYEANNVYNEVNNIFQRIDETTTKYITEQEFRFSGGMKVVGWLFPGAFKKQSMLSLEKFKRFVEG